MNVSRVVSQLTSTFTTRWQRLSRHQRIAFAILPIVLLLSIGVLLKLLSSNGTIAQQASPTNSVVNNDNVVEPESVQQRIAEHSSSVMTLQRWLLSGRNSKEEAGISLTMLQHLQAIAVDPSNDLAWQDYSDELSRLENAVEKQAITTPEATALIATLRYDYAQLRGSVAGMVDSGQDGGVVAAPTITSRGADNQALAKRSSLTPWLLALLPLLASALATVAWLFYQASQQPSLEQPMLRTVDSRANQNAILQLLDEMEPLADGDLRVQATVSEAMTGALADAFNYAVTELRWLVGAIKGSAAQVNESVGKTRDSANSLAQASGVQAREIHRSSNYLNVMSDTMAQLSAHAAESSRIAVDSVEQAQQGTLAIDASVKGLVNIREQAHMTSRLMERLVESSDAIKKHANDIQRVAKNTDLLALNTTIRAAAATGGGETSELSRLSAEVTQLASTLRIATRDIAHLAGIIHQDAALTLSSVKKTNSELDAGHQKAILASQSLKAIEAVSHDLQNQINDIASKTLRQAGVVRQLSANMGVINGITRDSAVGLQDAASDLEDLQLMANALLTSVAGFSLPDTDNDAADGDANDSVEMPTSASALVAKKIKAAVKVDHRSQELAGFGDEPPTSRNE